MFLLLLLAISGLHIDFYYQPGCSHCAATEKVFEELQINATMKNIRENGYLDEMFKWYDQFGVDRSKGGTPTIIIENRTMVIGELEKGEWINILEKCSSGDCPEGVITHGKVYTEGEELTWTVLIGAALVDSVNPCTIAVMVMLLATIFYAKGKKETLMAGLLFSGTIFVMYMFYGIGILKAITSLSISRLFYGIVTAGALILSIMEIKAYFNYKPGFLSVEMPMALRPLARKVTENAVSPLGVITAAMFCSLFLVPCSSGPYLMVLGMVAKSVGLNSLLHLVVYNLFFILPMVAITLAIYWGKTTVEKVREARDKYIKEIHLISGIILFILFLLMMKEFLSC